MKISIETSIPTMNNYWRTTIVKNRIHTYITPKGRQFKKALGWVAKVVCDNPFENDCELKIKLFFKNKNRDIDNAIKPILDALQGVVYVNDVQVKKITVEKFKSKNDNLEIEVIKYV